MDYFKGGYGKGLARILDAQSFLAVSRTKLYRLMADGELTYVKLGRSRRVRWDALHALIERLSRADIGETKGPTGVQGSRSGRGG